MAIIDPSLTTGNTSSSIFTDALNAKFNNVQIYGPGAAGGRLSGVYTASPPEFGYTTSFTMIYHANVERAENGYILKVVFKQGEVPKTYIAASTEELQRVFIAAIVAERVGK